MGRSRGGLTTKIHALVDACGLPILLKITEGQAHDGRSADDMLSSLGSGDMLLADRAYDSDALRLDLAERGARANVKLMPNRVNLPPFNKRLYRKRNVVERFFNKLKHFRAIATRYDKRDDNYLASIKLASARIWMRFNESMTWCRGVEVPIVGDDADGNFTTRRRHANKTSAQSTRKVI